MEKIELLNKLKSGEISTSEAMQLYKDNEWNDKNCAIIINKAGSLEDVTLSEVQPKSPKNNEVQIRVKACSLNFGDLLCVQGLYPTMPPYPFTPGFEVAGVVESIGSAVTRFKPNDEVIAIMGDQMGGHSSVVTVKEDWVVSKPKKLTFEEGCAFPITFLTVYYAFELAKPKKGESILIQTAAGGTGLIAVQLAKYLGLEIYGTASSEKKLEYLRDMGVQHPINYKEGFYKQIMELTSNKGVDLVFNTLSGEAIQQGINLLTSGGRYMEIAMTGLRNSSQISLKHMVDNQSFYSIDLRKFLMNQPDKVNNYLKKMLEYIELDVIKPTICRSFDFSDIKNAYLFMKNRENIGKVVVSVPKKIEERKNNTYVRPIQDKKIVEGIFTENDIAIIGMAGVWPGCENTDKFWEKLFNGISLISEVPKERWNIGQYFDENSSNLEKTDCRYGGFLSDWDAFDANFFQITNKEAEVMEPQQRVFLETCWNALEDAGYTSHEELNCGVYAGVCESDYHQVLRKNHVQRIPQSFWGNETSIIPARISYYLNLKGPAIAVNTACSSSLVAIHLATQSLCTGETQIAIAGGVFISTTPEFHIYSSNANMLSKTGKCSTFDENADGFVPGEASAAIVLKRLKDAMEDGDYIYGVIKGSGINQDGKTNGITAPNSLSQTKLLEDVYHKFNINPETIDYVEAHGTGTKLGDPIEVQSLTNAFHDFTSKENYCYIGSVKANAGHTVAAAGITSVVKVLESFQHKTIPPLINFNHLNSRINLQGTPFKINTDCVEWEDNDVKKRRAAINSFGFSGTNAHLVLEEAPEVQRQPRLLMTHYFIPISAKSKKALQGQIERLYYWLIENQNNVYIEDMAYSLLNRKMHFSTRIGLIVESIEELLDRLKDIIDKNLLLEKCNEIGNINYQSKTIMIRQGNKILNELNTQRLGRNKLDKEECYQKLVMIKDFYMKGYPIDWVLLYKGWGYRYVNLPTYAFQRDKYGYSMKEEVDDFLFYTPILNEMSIQSKNLEQNDLIIYIGNIQEEVYRCLSEKVDLYHYDLNVNGLKDIDDTSSTIYVVWKADYSIAEEKEVALFNKFLVIIKNLIIRFDNNKKIKFLYYSDDQSLEEQCMTQAIAALLRTVTLEHKNCQFAVLQFQDSMTNEEKAQIIARELPSIEENVKTIFYKEQKRFVKEIALIETEHIDKKDPFRENGVYWIVGGNGGIGAKLAQFLVNIYHATVYISGRKKEGNKDLVGCHYIQADVTRVQDVKKAYEKIKEKNPRIHGVFHLAGVIKDSLFVNKEKDTVKEVLDPKCIGIRNLDEITCKEELDFFVGFSSIASVVGNKGQADYAFANAFVDEWMKTREELVKKEVRFGKSISINWQLWQDGSMNITEHKKQMYMEQLGLTIVESDVAFEAMKTAIVINSNQVISLQGNKDKIEKLIKGQIVDDLKENINENIKENTKEHIKGKQNYLIKELKSIEEVINHITHIFADYLKMNVTEITADTSIEELGLDSLMIQDLSSELSNTFGAVSTTMLFEHKTIQSLGKALYKRFDFDAWDRQETEKGNVIRNKEREPIAIVGMSGKFPKADNIDEFWNNLVMGRDCITTVPKTRWDYEKYYDSDPSKAESGKIYCKHGGFINEAEGFDPMFFQVPPTKAEVMDPQERLLLETTWHAIEDSGYDPSKFGANNKVGVFIGVTNQTYQFWGPSEWDKGNYIFPESALWSMANRISYFFNFNGPSVPIDTACSASLTAVHAACQSLYNNECESAVVGGVNLYLHPAKYLGLCQMHMLSPTGKCSSFGKDANGFVPGEGVCVIVLKPLSMAKKDKDHIYAVIKGSAINHGGHTNGYTVPNPEAQADLIKSALEDSNLDSSFITAIEAHGTGTILGDPIEMAGLQKVFKKAENPFVSVSSLKSNIGHLEGAAGIAGLVKMALQLKHKLLVPTLYCEEENPKIDKDKSAFYFNKTLKQWDLDRNGETLDLRRGGISAYGAGGSNAHIILEEYCENNKYSFKNQREVIVLSARTESALRNSTKALYQYLLEKTGNDIKMIAMKLDTWLVNQMVELLQVNSGLVPKEEKFIDIGMNELLIQELCNRINLTYNLCLCFDEIIMSQTLNGVRNLMMDNMRKESNSNKEEISLSDIAYTLYEGRMPMRERIAIIAGSLEDLIMKLGYIIDEKTDDCEIYRGSAITTTRVLDTEGMELKDIAKKWTEGYEVKWDSVRKEQDSKRISLPGYVFDNEAYWFQNNTMTSIIEVDGETEYIKDHVVNGQKILPAAAYIAMVYYESMYLNDSIYSINDLMWLEPLIVEKGKKEMRLSIKQSDDERNLVFQSDELVENCIGRILRYENHDVKKYNLTDLYSKFTHLVSKEECYRILKEGGIEYGPSLQVIQEVIKGDHGCLSHLKATYVNQKDRMICLLDGCLQSIIGVHFETDESTFIPFSIGEVNILKPMKPEVWAVITKTAGIERAVNNIYGLSIDVIDETGEVLVQLKDIMLKEHIASKGILKDTGTIFMKEEWIEKHLEGSVINNLSMDTIAVIDKEAGVIQSGNEILSIVNEQDIYDYLSQFNTKTMPKYFALIGKANPSDSTEVLEETYYFMQRFLSGLLRLSKGSSINLIYIFNTNNKKYQKFYNSVGAFYKTVMQENTALKCKTVGTIYSGDMNSIIMNEISDGFKDCSVMYVDGKRCVTSLKEIDIMNVKKDALRFRENGVYIITGGLGKIGYEFASYIAKQYHASIILFGRSSYQSVEEKCKKLEILGASVMYYTVDLTEENEVQKVMKQIEDQYITVNGLIHCAGVNRDSFVINKSKEQMQQVFETKIQSLVMIDQLAQNMKLDFVILCSSITALTGNVGQSDYAYCNKFLAEFSKYRNQLVKDSKRYGHTIAIEWPYWKNGGMQIANEYIDEYEQQLGILPMPNEEGIRIFTEICEKETEEIAVFYGKQDKIRSVMKGQLYGERREIDMGDLKQRSLNQKLLEMTEELLKEILAKETKFNVMQINVKEPLQNYGIDSLLVVKINRSLEHYFGKVSKTLLFEYQTLEELGLYLVENYTEILKNIFKEEILTSPKINPSIHSYESNTAVKVVATEQKETKTNERGNSKDIAIIGLSGRYPMASELEDLWESLKQGKDCITEIPKSRWDNTLYYEKGKGKGGKINSNWGGFLEDIDTFDANFFNIIPSEAEWMDPQERIFMETVWHTLEDAGYTRDRLKSTTVGVFAGMMYAQYNLIETDVNGTTMYPVGSYATLANRVSYFYNFRGPSMTVDTMCSSSLTTIHLACESILRGECEAAIAGGVNLTVHPNKYLHLSMSGFTSSDGRCRSFGHGGDGYVPGEGVGAVLLKSLDQAIKDNDHIYGVIKGSYINHGGKTNGYTVPNPLAQTQLIEGALKDANWTPDSISYVEAHGTGTFLGDPIEINSLNSVFRRQTEKQQFCSLGSIKSNIGHLESAAGIAAVTKVLLMLKHKQLVPTLHSEIVNENIDFSESPFYLQHQLQEWKPIAYQDKDKTKYYPRRAAIGAFGAGGSNAYVLIEEFNQETVVSKSDTWEETLIVLSAKTKERLHVYVQQMIQYMEKQGESHSLKDIAYTLQIGREALDFRLAAIVSSKEDLITMLKNFMKNDNDSATFYEGVKSQNNIVLDGIEGEQYIRSLLQNKRLKKLAQLWVFGVDVDWNILYKEERLNIVHIPGYPFKKEHIWIAMKPKHETIRVETSIHPLINQNTSTLYEQKFTTDFTGKEFFLKDHVINGNAFLPAAAQLMMASIAGQKSVEQIVGGFKNVVWKRPVICASQGLSLDTKLQLDGDRILFTLLNKETREEFTSGELSFELNNQVANKVNLDELKARCQDKLDKEAVYNLFNSKEIVYGESLKCIQSMYYSSEESFSVLEASNYKEEYYFDISMVDAAIQSMIGVLLQDNKKEQLSYLPYSVDEMTYLHSLSYQMYAYVFNKRSMGEEVCVDIQLINNQGDVCIEMKGLHIKAYHRDGKVTYYKNVWKLKSRELNKISSQKIGFLDQSHNAKEMNGSAWIKVSALTDVLQYGDNSIRDFVIYSDVKSEKTVDWAIKEYFVNLLHFIQKRMNGSNENIRILYLLKANTKSNIYIAQQALVGMAKVISLEYPTVQFAFVDLSEAEIGLMNADVIKQEFQEMKGSVTEVKYIKDKRYVAELEESLLELQSEIVLREKGVYWITGGMGALGMKLAKYLAKNYKASLVLTGRSSMNSNYQTYLNELESMGIEAIYLQVDIQNKEEVQIAYQSIKQRFVNINGIFHLAGRLKDAWIRNKDEKSCIEVISPKVNGMVHLDEVTKVDELDFLVAFSSMASIVGNYGQVDYAYANAFLNAYASQRNKKVAMGLRSGKTISIAWPLWEDGSMLLSVGLTEKMIENTGLRPISDMQAFKILEDSLSSKESQIIVTYGEKILRNKNSQEVERYSSSETVEQIVKKVIMRETKLSEDSIVSNQSWGDLGIDSTIDLRIIIELEKYFGNLPKTILFDYTTFDQLVGFIKSNYNFKTQLDEAITINSELKKPSREVRVLKNNEILKSHTEDDIAIVGLSGIYPQAENIDIFWENLKNGKDCITEIPKERWDYSKFYDNEKGKLGKSYSKWGGFIDNVGAFDPLFFNISPKEAISMDPQQRLFLETAWHTFEDGGYVANNLRGRDIGVFVGVMYGQYQLYNTDENVQQQGTVLDSSYASIVNRLSYFLDLKGPSMAIDTMCSSSLTAIHLACQSIRDGECEMALAGGVNLSLHPSKYINLSQGNFVSSEGVCRSFGEGGDGYVPGEGVGAVLLKPLSKAKNDGDIIYGVIKATAMNHGGRTKGFTVPNTSAQKSVIHRALKAAHWSADEISYIEAHGTGTALGDPIETNALAQVFQEYHVNEKCPIGSVKSNIGHLEAASGIAALTKVLLMMKHKTLVKSLHAENLNPYIEFDKIPFYVQSKIEPWTAKNGDNTLKAGISSFGAGGSNVHLLLESYENVKSSTGNTKPQTIVLSAKNWNSLTAYMKKLRDYLVVNQDTLLLEDVAYTLQCGREIFDKRIAFFASNMEHLIAILSQCSQDFLHTEDIFTNHKDAIHHNPKNSWEEVSMAWVNGEIIEWKKEIGVKRISLPGYAFNNENYWLIYEERKNEGIVQYEISKPTLKLSLKANETVDQMHSGVQVPEKLKLTGLKDTIEITPVNVVATLQEETSTEEKYFEQINGMSDEMMKQVMKGVLSEVLYLDQDKIEDNQEFISLGMDSVLATEFVKKVGKEFEVEIKTVDIYDNKTVNELISYIKGVKKPNITIASKKIVDIEEKEDTIRIPYVEEKTKEVENKTKGVEDYQGIAIVGLSGHYPLSDNINELWENLKSEKNCVTEIPKERWDYREFFNENDTSDYKVHSKWGGFIKDVDKFDPLLFNISPREASQMDPQTRIMMETVWEVLEDAGYSKTSRLNNNDKDVPNVGVFIGAMYQQYPWLNEDKKQGAMYSSNSYWNIVNRISHYFEFNGPSMAVDTACSSSMSAVYLACESLKHKKCQVAIAGGINLSLIPEKYCSIMHMGMLSSADKSQSLGSGDGYVPSEGAGAVMLKPLEEAIRDRDHIYGVIKSCEVNHGGNTKSLTVPNPIAQAELMQRAIHSANLTPDDIGYVELSATGASIGDIAEIQSLQKVFSNSSNVSIGTVKSNLGHLEACSGIAQLTKVALMFDNKQLIPTINYEPLNPEIHLYGTPIKIQNKIEEIKQDSFKVLIDCFGAGGSNVCLVVEAYEMPKENFDEFEDKLMILSAQTKYSLQQMLHRIYDYLKGKREVSLSQFMYTLQVGRKELGERIAILFTNKEDLEEKLKLAFNEEITSNAILRASFKLHSKAANLLDNTAYAVEMVENWTKQGNIEKLALAFIKGMEVDWSKLPQNQKCHTISLPTYCFEKESYWINQRTTKKVVPNTDKTNVDIQQLVSSLTELSIEKLDCDVDLLHYGLDSLMMMKLYNRMKEAYGVEIPLSTFMKLETIGDIADYIRNNKCSKNEEESLENLLSLLEEGKISPEEVNGML